MVRLGMIWIAFTRERISCFGKNRMERLKDESVIQKDRATSLLNRSLRRNNEERFLTSLANPKSASAV